MEPVTLYGVIVRTPSGEDWLDAGTMRYTPEAAREAGQEFYGKAHSGWKKENTPYAIRKFYVTEEKPV